MTSILERPSLTATPGQVDWLRDQVRAWHAEGLLDADQAAAILDRYVATRRLSLARLLLWLGGAFVGVGLLWLVAANLDALAPSARFLAVVVLWLALLTGGELLHARGTTPALAAAVRLAAALAVGAVIFQAAQSLQVPAYEPSLVGCWALAALVHAYVLGAVGPLVVGVAAGTVWVVWEVVATSGSATAALTMLAATGLAAASLAVLHRRGRPTFATPWRECAALLVLGTLFTAALPLGAEVGDGGPLTGLRAAALLVAVLLAGAALWWGEGRERLEPLLAAAALAATWVLVSWQPGAEVSAPAVGRAVVAVAVYVLVAVGVAVLGILHDSWRLTALATLGLVGFTTAQSFAVFARIVDGAWLFLLLGVVLVGTGWGFDRARRGLAAVINEEERS